MATVMVRGDAEDLHAARAALARLADEYEAEGMAPDEIWPQLNAIEERLAEFRAHVKREIANAA